MWAILYYEPFGRMKLLSRAPRFFVVSQSKTGFVVLTQSVVSLYLHRYIISPTSDDNFQCALVSKFYNMMR